jgi:hypothetical protein
MKEQGARRKEEGGRRKEEGRETRRGEDKEIRLASFPRWPPWLLVS